MKNVQQKTDNTEGPKECLKYGTVHIEKRPQYSSKINFLNSENKLSNKILSFDINYLNKIYLYSRLT